MTHPCILVVDDDDAKRRTLVRLVERLRPEVEVYDAPDAGHALDFILHPRWKAQLGCVVTDWEMPVSERWAWDHGTDDFGYPAKGPPGGYQVELACRDLGIPCLIVSGLERRPGRDSWEPQPDNWLPFIDAGAGLPAWFAHRCACGRQGDRQLEPLRTGEAAVECTLCETFWCPRCEKWTPWGNGCADDMPSLCDDCWAEVNDEPVDDWDPASLPEGPPSAHGNEEG